MGFLCSGSYFNGRNLAALLQIDSRTGVKDLSFAVPATMEAEPDEVVIPDQDVKEVEDDPVCIISNSSGTLKSKFDEVLGKDCKRKAFFVNDQLQICVIHHSNAETRHFVFRHLNEVNEVNWNNSLVQIECSVIFFTAH